MKKKPAACHGGAYIITHEATGVEYVGSTANLAKRRSAHISELRRNKHPSKDFQNAYNNDPRISFKFYITEDREGGFDLEQQFLNRPDVKMFNAAKNARASALGRQITDEHKAVLRKIRTGKKATDETKKRIGKASRERMNNPDMVDKIRQKSIQQFSDPAAREHMRKVHLGRKHSKESVSNMLKGREHTMQPVSIDGVEYPNARDASRILNIPYTTIKNRCKSSSPAFEGWKFGERKKKED